MEKDRKTKAMKELEAWTAVRSHLTDQRYTEESLHDMLTCEIYHRVPRPHVVTKLFKRYWKLCGNRVLIETLAEVRRKLEG